MSQIPLMSSASLSQGGSFPSGLYVLNMTGSETDFEKVEEILKPFPNFQLGPLVWIVALPDQTANAFADSISFCLPESERAELFLCLLGKAAILHASRGGSGLQKWLEEQGFLPSR